VNYALSIQDVEVAAFFREMPDGRYRVSLRSKGGLNVANIAERFGGGGHECASAVRWMGRFHRGCSHACTDSPDRLDSKRIGFRSDFGICV